MILASFYKKLFLFCTAAWGLCCFVFWPGVLRPDSIMQMQQGISGILTDHHPPAMAFLWGVFHHLYPGSGLMLLFHLILYWGAVYLYAKASLEKSWMFFCIALLPMLIVYQPFVLKDIAFVNAFLFGCAWLYYYTLQKKKPSLLAIFFWALIVFYGSAVKYQSIFVLPWLCLWFAKLYWTNKKWILKGVSVYALFFLSIEGFNSITSTPSHSWQYVKMYDLAGISVGLNHDIFPQCIKRPNHYSFKRIEELYNPRRVDDMAFNSNSPLQKVETAEERKIIWHAWAEMVWKYPLLYLKHRASIFYQQLTVSFLKAPDDIKSDTSSWIIKIIRLMQDFKIFSIAQLLMSYGLHFILQVLFVSIGITRFNSSLSMQALFFQNMAGLSLILSLFVFSMASEARYAYLGIALLNFSYPFLLSARKYI